MATLQRKLVFLQKQINKHHLRKELIKTSRGVRKPLCAEGWAVSWGPAGSLAANEASRTGSQRPCWSHVAQRQRVLGAQPPFLCPQSLGGRPPRSGHSKAGWEQRRVQGSQHVLRAGRTHTKTAHREVGALDPALPGSFPGLSEAGLFFPRGGGRPAFLSGDVGVVSLVGARLGRGPSRSSQACHRDASTLSEHHFPI